MVVGFFGDRVFREVKIPTLFRKERERRVGQPGGVEILLLRRDSLCSSRLRSG